MSKANHMQKRQTKTTLSVNGNISDDMPRIKWSQLGVMDSLDLAEIENESGEITILNRLLNMGRITNEQIERLMELQSISHQREVIEKRFEAMAKYVEYVPANWFVDGAGDGDMDFSKPETYRLMRSDKCRTVYQMLIFGQQTTDQATGNSKGG